MPIQIQSLNLYQISIKNDVLHKSTVFKEDITLIFTFETPTYSFLTISHLFSLCIAEFDLSQTYKNITTKKCFCKSLWLCLCIVFSFYKYIHSLKICIAINKEKQNCGSENLFCKFLTNSKRKVTI